MSIKRNELIFLMLCIFLLFTGSVFLNLVGIDAIKGLNQYQFFADSNTYHKIYDGDSSLYHGSLVDVSSNYLGPLSILNITGGNFYLVLILNLSLFFISTILISRVSKIPALNLGVLLLLNPMTLSSILSVNKEILFLLSFSFFTYGYHNNNKLLILVSVIISAFSRWQLTAVFIFLIVINLIYRKSHKKIIIIYTLFISFFYFFYQDIFQSVIDYSQSSIESYEEGGSGLFAWLLDIQSHGFYFLIVPIKLIHLNYSMSLKIFNIPDFYNFYNDVIVVTHSASLLLISIACWKKHKARMIALSSDWLYIAIILILTLGLTPVFATRYFYPLYVILAVFLLSKNHNIFNKKIN